MKVEFLNKFSKDLDDLKVKSVKQSLIHLIESFEAVDKLEKIPNTKKLKGHKTAYRTRVGDYRLGNSTILLARFVNRKDIYKVFPSMKTEAGIKLILNAHFPISPEIHTFTLQLRSVLKINYFCPLKKSIERT